MQKIQSLHKNINVLGNQVSGILPMQILKLYADDGLVRFFIFRLVSSGIVVERLTLN